MKSFYGNSIPIAVPISSSIDDLTGVNILNPQVGEVLEYTGALWENKKLSLNNLTDVITTTPENRQVLRYDTGLGIWKNQNCFDYLVFVYGSGDHNINKNEHHISTNIGGNFTIIGNIVGSRFMLTAGPQNNNIIFDDEAFIANWSEASITPNPSISLLYASIELVCYFKQTGQSYYYITNLQISNGGYAVINGEKIGPKINNLLDVNINNPLNNEVLKYNSGLGVWQNGTDSNTGLTSVGLNMPNVFSVSNSPLITNGSISVSFNPQTAHKFLAGDLSGNGAVIFRSIDSTDLPTLSLNNLSDVLTTTPTNGQYLKYSGTKFINGSLYNVAELTNTTITATANSYYSCGDNVLINLYLTYSISEKVFVFKASSGSQSQIVLPAGGYLNGTLYPAGATLNNTYGHVEFITTGQLNWQITSFSGNWAINGNLSTIIPYSSYLTRNIDVNINTPTNGQLLRYNGSVWENITPTYISSASLATLTGTLITTPAANEILSYNGSKWINSHAAHSMPTAELTFCNTGTAYTCLLATQNTYYLIEPTTTLNSNNSEFMSNKFDMPINGRLRYIGAMTMKFHCAFSLCCSTPTATNSYRLVVKKNNVDDVGTYFNIDFANNNEYTSSAQHKIIELAQNDYIEVFMTCLTANTKQVGFINFNIVAMSTMMSH